ncbi:MAG: hypothetical protein ABIU05_12240, partial [Nitrospirales bacterium]
MVSSPLRRYEDSKHSTLLHEPATAQTHSEGMGVAYESQIRLNSTNRRAAAGKNVREDCRNVVDGDDFNE